MLNMLSALIRYVCGYPTVQENRGVKMPDLFPTIGTL